MELKNLELVCYRIKLKPDSIEKVKSWGAKLNSEHEEVAKLLKNEGIVIESAFLEQSSEGNFLIYYVRAHDLKKAQEISAASLHPIDQFHKQVMREITESAVVLEKVLDISSE